MKQGMLGLAVLSLVCAGCGGGDKGGVPVYPITGTVKMFGKPLPKATVAFAPQGDQPTAVGTTDEDGSFVVTTYEYGDGAAEGTFSVVVSKTVTKPTAESGGSGDGEGHEAEYDQQNSHDSTDESGGSEALVPALYSSADSSPLTVEVKAGGDNHFDLEIK